MKQCQYYPQNNRNCSDCRMNMEQERGKSKIAIAAFDKYYLLLVIELYGKERLKQPSWISLFEVISELLLLTEGTILERAYNLHCKPHCKFSIGCLLFDDLVLQNEKHFVLVQSFHFVFNLKSNFVS